MQNDLTSTLAPLRTSSWKTALPRGRQGWDLGAEVLTFHTVTDLDAYEELCDTGVLQCDPSRSDQEFAEAYAWMRQQHAKRIPGSTGGPLTWGWVQTTRYELQKALYAAVRYSDAPQLLLRCEIPRERVLVSEFSEYHAVLNRWEVLHPETPEAEEERLVDAFFDAREAAGVSNAPLSDWPEELRNRMTSSWELIFDQSLWLGRSHWQGCVEEIRASEVVEAVALTR